MEFTVSGIPNVQIAMRRASHRANACGLEGCRIHAVAWVATWGRLRHCQSLCAMWFSP